MVSSADLILTNYLVVKNKRSYVAYAKRSNGNVEAKEYFDRLPKQIQAYFVRKFELLINGVQLPLKQFKKLPGTNGIFEFKHYSKARIFCFKDSGGWWLTHGHYKQKNKADSIQTNRAHTIKEEHSHWNIIKGEKNG